METDRYFHVPLGIDIQTISDKEINQHLQDMSRNNENSDMLKRSIHFFVEYYNKSVRKLLSMGYDDLFVKDLLRDKNGNIIDSKEEEMKISLDKLRVEFNRFLTSKYNINIKYLLEDPSYKPRFVELFSEFFRERCIKIAGNFSTDLILDNIANYLYDYVTLKSKDISDVEEYRKIYSAIMSLDAQVLAKYNRLLNLEAKLAHTSRMVFMTIYNTQDMKDDKLRELCVLSVMYHDIGRIYQALYYPSFLDAYIDRGESKGTGLLTSHAEVGYYFPMQNLIVQDLIRCNGDIDEALVLHTLMSVVTKYHGRSNTEMTHYDVTFDDVSLDRESIGTLEGVLLEVFKRAEQIPVHARFDTLSNINHMQEFHSDIASYIIKSIITVSEFKHGRYTIDQEAEELIARIDKYLRYFYNGDDLEDLYEHPEKLNNRTVLEKMFGINPPDDFDVSSIHLEEDVKKRLQNISDQILTVDYASVLNDIVAGNTHGIEMTPEVRQLLVKTLGAIMTITTDMDKIDILNQRINGSWEKTNKSRFDRDPAATGPLTREEVVDDLSRSTFFREVVIREKTRGRDILHGSTKPNAIKALWFHLDQFVTVNLRNYRCFELLKNNEYLEKIRVHMIEEQDENKREIIAPLINEPIAFAEQFIDFVLHTRVNDNGELVYPVFDMETGLYHNDNEFKPPVLFTGVQMAEMRNIVLQDFKRYYTYNDFKPLEDNLPVPRSLSKQPGVRKE